MNGIQKGNKNYPVSQGDNFIQEVIQRHLNTEPRRETNFLSNIFSRRVTNNFIRIKVYNNCTFHISGGEEDD